MNADFENDRRLLIVNADDFGQSHGINQGICEAFEQGIVTSASLMVRWEAARTAAAYSREHPQLSVGLHADFGEWTCRHGAWVALYEVVSSRNEDAVHAELWKQIDMFVALTGRTPTHLDSHQHIHRGGFIRDLFSDAAERIGIPLRDAASDVRYCGAFYGQTAEGLPLPQNITPEALGRIADNLKPGFTELGCHPAKVIDIDLTYGSERLEEFNTLSQTKLRELLEAKSIRLCSFHDFAGALK